MTWDLALLPLYRAWEWKEVQGPKHRFWPPWIYRHRTGLQVRAEIKRPLLAWCGLPGARRVLTLSRSDGTEVAPVDERIVMRAFGLVGEGVRTQLSGNTRSLSWPVAVSPKRPRKSIGGAA